MKTFADFNIDISGKSGIEVKALCPQCSHTRKKANLKVLNVNTEKGVWNCWHCGWAGTLLSGQDNRPNPYEYKPKTYHKPEWEARPDMPEKPIAWFRDRGITPEVLVRNKISYGPVYMPQVEREVNAVQFPYFRNSEIVNVKYRDGEKNFRMYSGAERILYGYDDIAEKTVIVEGEIDKLSFEVAGIPWCVSVPDGAPAAKTKDYSSKFEFLENSKLGLERVKTFVIAVDSDEPGKRLEEELVRRLGREKCHRVAWPEDCKDANEVLLKHGTTRLVDCYTGAMPYPIDDVHTMNDMLPDIRNMYESTETGGATTGWDCVDQFYTVLPGEFTVVTGIPGHGKSEFLDALMVNLATSNGWRFLICSPENMPIADHATKILEKVSGKPFSRGQTERLTLAEVEVFSPWMSDHFFFYSPKDDNLTVDLILAKAKEMVLEKGITGFIVDPWNELEHDRPSGLSETEYISKAITRFRVFGRMHGVHVWLVAHPTKLRKGEDGSYPVPTLWDISGSAHWRNKADNGIVVWRDVLRGGNSVDIHIQKVRKKRVGKPGKAELIYNRVTGQYSEAPRIYPKTHLTLTAGNDR